LKLTVTTSNGYTVSLKVQPARPITTAEAHDEIQRLFELLMKAAQGK
jgi:hypothetical protein